MSTQASLVTGVDFVAIQSPTFFSDLEGNPLIRHHRYAPPGESPPKTG